MKAELQDAIDLANAPMAERDELADQGRLSCQQTDIFGSVSSCAEAKYSTP